jgi:hypothetical protein
MGHIQSACSTLQARPARGHHGHAQDVARCSPATEPRNQQWENGLGTSTIMALHRDNLKLAGKGVLTGADEDITNMDTPTVVAYNSKVKLFFSIIIFNTCDEWMLHHDMCSMSFTEVLTWIKEGVDHAWK